MNDIPNVSQPFRFILYADDSNLFSTIEYSIPIRTLKADELLNQELLEIEKVETFDFLSFTLDENLT